jgi:putative protease
MAKAKLSYQEGKETRKRPLNMTLTGKIGSTLRLQACDGEHTAVAESQAKAQEAVNRPLNYEYLYRQLGRLGNTPFVLKQLAADIPDNLIIPVSEINDLRRSVVEQLLQNSCLKQSGGLIGEMEFKERLKQWRQKIRINIKEDCLPGRDKSIKNAADIETRKNIKPQLSIAVADLNSIASLLQSGVDRIIAGGEHWRFSPQVTLKDLQQTVAACREKGVEFIWRLPRIMNEEQSQKIFAELRQISLWQERPAIMTANLAGISMIQSLDPQWKWETDHFLYVFNRAAMLWVLEAGGKRTAISTELSREQLQTLSIAEAAEIIVFGDMEMMISEFCLIGAMLGHDRDNPREKCGRVCQGKTYYLKDRFSYQFPLLTDKECRMHIFNSRKLNLIAELNKIAETGLKNIRLELPRASLDQARETAKIFKELWAEASAGRVINPKETEKAMHKLESLYPEGFTKGHFYRGVLA